MKSFLIVLALLAAPTLAGWGKKPPHSQIKPCMEIDAAAITNLRLVYVELPPVAKSDYQPSKAEKKSIYDRVPEERK